ncbi:MAG: type II pantothenate kinase [Kurthia sp.]|nr:type II pantothenate kinase [Candidatus Kurthia equi]
MVLTIGIDAGGTLTKIAYLDEQKSLVLDHFQSHDLQAVADFIEAHPEIEKIAMTGGRAEQLNQLIRSDVEVNYLVEFEATLIGVKYLLEKNNQQFKDAIITNIGSGTSIHYMDENKYARVGGTGIGGGTLVGLSALLTDVYSYREMSNLAQQGSRKEIDLLVADIFQGQPVPAPLKPDLTASNFGKIGIKPIQEYKKEDKLASVARLVGEVITTLSIQLAEQHSTDHIIYIGTTLKDHEVLQHVIKDYTVLKNKSAIFLNDRGFGGAIGALKSILK